MERLTKRKAFNFLRSYFDVLNKIDKEEEKLAFLLSIINKQFLDEDPKDLNFLVDLCYSSQKHAIESSVKGWKRVNKTDLIGNPTTDPPTNLPTNPITDPKEEEEKGEEQEEGQEKLIKIVPSPPIGVDALHFYIAKTYHNMFYTYKGSKSLENAELKTWVNTIRLLLDVDKVTIAQLVAIKHFLQAGIDKERGVDTFWSDTIYSISSLRKKSKDGIYQFDRIKQAAKKWIEKNPDKEQLVYKAEASLMKRVNGE
jgi:hypothetical protein